MKHKQILAAALIVAGVLLAAVAVDLGVSSPRLCASCHEIGPRAETWSRSAHHTVSCVECHLPVRPWYALPQRVADRVGLLQRDVTLHFTGAYAAPVEEGSHDTPPMSDEICLQCHDPNRKATSGFRILIDHAEHAKRNGSCVSCHVRTAHPIESRSKAMTLMTQCFTCHGVDEGAKAPGDCGLCHPSGYPLLPQSHKPAKEWRSSHGEISVKDPRQCGMCHRRKFCDDCHGLDMPHPDKWAQGRTGHGRIAQVNRALCSQCHEGGPDMCTMCHHDGFEPAKGTWVKQHYNQVKVKGLDGCLDCHSPVFCSGCHVSGAPPQPY